MSEDLVILEKPEAYILAQRRRYLRNRVNRVFSLFVDDKRKEAISLLVERLEMLSQQELSYFILGGNLPDIPNDQDQPRSIMRAAEFSSLHPDTIRNIAQRIYEEREKIIEREHSERMNSMTRKLTWVAIGVSICSVATLGTNLFLTHFN